MPIVGKSGSIHCGKGPWSDFNGSVVNTWLYGPRWFCNPLIILGVPTYNVVPYPSSVTIAAPSPVIQETVVVPQTVVHRFPPRYSSSPPISRTTLIVKPQSQGQHSSRSFSLAEGIIATHRQTEEPRYARQAIIVRRNILHVLSSDDSTNYQRL